ncbi:hypothetical protein HELRODRAFT_194240 [Helobdella robusta]|uniref:Protein aurora borealis n=1 Tax=Helobdella robusta TaxID=6412 RepID=T1FVU7_HELRO|nr:hypothetical protein HELRODRAFT_194240 [Helobdella robusta]ESN92389.1 hypothetical protein HELRODRAFT_194240 [Helobdella robusta]
MSGAKPKQNNEKLMKMPLVAKSASTSERVDSANSNSGAENQQDVIKSTPSKPLNRVPHSAQEPHKVNFCVKKSQPLLLLKDKNTPFSPPPNNFNSPRFKSTPASAWVKQKNFQTPKSDSRNVTNNNNNLQQQQQSYYNPFETGLLDSLSQHICSPNVFKVITPDRKLTPKFRWSIDDLALLKPAHIEDPPLHSVYNLNAELEERAQQAIDEFFSTHVIAPSPWSTASSKKKQASKYKKSTNSTATIESPMVFSHISNNSNNNNSSNKNVSNPRRNIITSINNSSSNNSSRSARSQAVVDACTQTSVSLPADVDLISLIGSKFILSDEKLSTMIGQVPANGKQPSRKAANQIAENENETDSFGNLSLRRKLFFQNKKTHASPFRPLPNISCNNNNNNNNIKMDISQLKDLEDEFKTPNKRPSGDDDNDHSNDDDDDVVVGSKDNYDLFSSSPNGHCPMSEVSPSYRRCSASSQFLHYSPEMSPINYSRGLVSSKHGSPINAMEDANMATPTGTPYNFTPRTPRAVPSNTGALNDDDDDNNDDVYCDARSDSFPQQSSSSLLITSASSSLLMTSLMTSSMTSKLGESNQTAAQEGVSNNTTGYHSRSLSCSNLASYLAASGNGSGSGSGGGSCQQQQQQNVSQQQQNFVQQQQHQQPIFFQSQQQQNVSLQQYFVQPPQQTVLQQHQQQQQHLQQQHLQSQEHQQQELFKKPISAQPQRLTKHQHQQQQNIEQQQQQQQHFKQQLLESFQKQIHQMHIPQQAFGVFNANGSFRNFTQSPPGCQLGHSSSGSGDGSSSNSRTPSHQQQQHLQLQKPQQQQRRSQNFNSKHYKSYNLMNVIDYETRMSLGLTPIQADRSEDEEEDDDDDGDGLPHDDFNKGRSIRHHQHLLRPNRGGQHLQLHCAGKGYDKTGSANERSDNDEDDECGGGGDTDKEVIPKEEDNNNNNNNNTNNINYNDDSSNMSVSDLYNQQYPRVSRSFSDVMSVDNDDEYDV